MKMFRLLVKICDDQIIVNRWKYNKVYNLELNKIKQVNEIYIYNLNKYTQYFLLYTIYLFILIYILY